MRSAIKGLMDESRSPLIYYLELPADEQKIGAVIVQNLRGLEAYRRFFEDDLGLFDFAYDHRHSEEPAAYARGVPWMFIAARDGAMQLYHFGMTLRAFAGLLSSAPTLAAMTDTKAVEQAKRVFEDHFKDFYEIRQGVAHVADHSVTPARRERHAVKKSDKYVTFLAPRLDDGSIAETERASFFARNNLDGRTYWGTVEGRSVEYEITQLSLDKLR